MVCASIEGAIAYVSEAFVKREKQKARILRKSPWWKTKCSSGTCYYCKRSIPPSELTMDHIIPLSKGGMSIKSNIAAACKECNDRKKHTLPFKWAEYMESLNQPAEV
ncbi:MAG: HNH endonuclease [Nitrospirae bacterium]|nr:HNH endonuclease [Nitrospirota bacterium]